MTGVGADPREDRYFNIVKQAKDYDPKAEYIRLWCPEIAHLPTSVLLDPRLLTEDTTSVVRYIALKKQRLVEQKFVNGYCISLVVID